MNTPFLPTGFVPISGRFQYSLAGESGSLRFDWDGAGMGPGGETILIERELARPVSLHIHGHLARAELMVSLGEKVSRVVWVIQAQDFQGVWRIVETWRRARSGATGSEMTPCEYWTDEGELIAISPPRSRTKSGARPDLDGSDPPQVSP